MTNICPKQSVLLLAECTTKRIISMNYHVLGAFLSQFCHYWTIFHIFNHGHSVDFKLSAAHSHKWGNSPGLKLRSSDRMMPNNRTII